MVRWQAGILSTDTICAEAGRYLGWPTIVRRANGELLVAFSGDRDEHVCPWGKTQIIRSSDGGRSWSAPRTITDTPLDDRDAGIIETRSGSLLVSWFTSVAFADWEERLRGSYGDAMVDGWCERIASLSPALLERWLGSWVRRSTDGGATWGEPIGTLGSAPHGPMQLRDGRLLYVGKSGVGSDGPLTVEASPDDGRTWAQISTISIPPEESRSDYHEPHVVETRGGKLLVLIRYQPSAKLDKILLIVLIWLY